MLPKKLTPLVVVAASFLVVLQGKAQNESPAATSALELHREALDALAEMPAEPEELARMATPETFAAIERGLDLVRQASEAGPIDWGIDWEQTGFDVDFAHLQDFRHAVRVAHAYHQNRIDEGEFERLVDDSAAIWSLSRHMAGNGALIHHLVARAGESLAVHFLAANANRFPPAILEELQQLPAALPSPPRLAEALRSEEKAIRGHLWNALAGVADLSETEEEEFRPDNEALARLRISSIVSIGGEVVSIGFEDHEGRSFTLRPGQERHGFRLESIDVTAGRAVVWRGGEAAVVSLAGRTLRSFDVEAGWRRLTRHLEEGLPGIDLDLLLEEAGHDIGRAFDRLLEKVHVAFEQLREITALPYNEFPAEMPEGANSYADHMFVAGGNVLQVGFRLQALHELFEASLDYHLNPESPLPASQLTGEPIAIEQDEKGLLFRSPYLWRGEPLTIEIRPPHAGQR